ncbi:hypothetical protein M9H77_07045 [Catharanthus roseus]|uniref:Uncharacterized protein n=1 Tax=Catharanthus roseus TaxID=4058 RepID=A0ACC0BU06_CATRO|nr:hypothetical protein M9H77_07045 [Catharanthus roseus]
MLSLLQLFSNLRPPLLLAAQYRSLPQFPEASLQPVLLLLGWSRSSLLRLPLLLLLLLSPILLPSLLNAVGLLSKISRQRCLPEKEKKKGAISAEEGPDCNFGCNSRGSIDPHNSGIRARKQLQLSSVQKIETDKFDGKSDFVIWR